MTQLTNNNIAQTGLRTLFVLQMLIKGPVSKAQIMSKIALNPYLKKVASDTIRLDINTLKSAGFDIKTGNKGNNYCYELKLNPIKINLNKKEMRSLSLAKKAVFNFMDFRYIISLYSTLEKVAKLIEPDEDVREILNFGNFLKMDFGIIRELDVHSNHKNEITILYESPRNGLREMDIKCIELKYSKKNDKLYLWCKSNEYKDPAYLRAEKIKKIIRINKMNTGLEEYFKHCTYKVSRCSNSPFELEDFEKVIKITPAFVEIVANYHNDFNLVQRLLSLGDDLIYVDNKNIVNKLKEAVTNIRKIYS